MYHNTQSNTTRPTFSSTAQNKPKERNFNVSYRTQEHLDSLKELGFQYLRSPTTNKNKTTFALLKIISWDILNKGHCYIPQGSFGGLLKFYGYEKEKPVQERQIRRALAKLRDAGFITYERKNPRERLSVNSYKVTDLGLDMYHYFIQENKWLVQLSAIELHTKSVDNFCEVEKTTGAFQENDRWSKTQNLNDSGPREIENQKNDRYLNIPYIKKYINTIRVERANKPSHIFSFNPYLEPEPEAKAMTQPSPNLHLTAEQLQVVEEILEGVDVRMGDEAVLQDEIVQALAEYRLKGIQVTDFKFFANAVREQTWKKYYWDMRPNAGMRH